MCESPPRLHGQWDSYVAWKVEHWQNSHCGISWLQSQVGCTFCSVAHDADFSWGVLCGNAVSAFLLI